jgi:hypothetical protein
MQIVKAEGQYRIYGENIEVYDELEPDFYQFMVDDHGPYIVRTSKPELNDKVYGKDQTKVEKCFKTYQSFNRSLGIMLVGDKGNGKTLFAKQMCIKMINSGYPVINVNFYHPSLPMFMTQISQECVFLFDEFEKMFEHDERLGSAQNEMLSTFDGINMTKKMFIITCNDISKLSQYIYNRPGRFHYSFTFSEPTYTDIECYLRDNINTETCIEKVDDIVLFCYINGLNYDCLRSLSFELNNGYSLVDSFDDLNIGYSEDKRGYIHVIYENGEILKGDFNFTPFSDRIIGCDVHPNRAWYSVGTVRFRIHDIKYDPTKDLYIAPEDFKIEWDNPASTDNMERKDDIMHFRGSKPSYISVNITKNTKINPLRYDWGDDNESGKYMADEITEEVIRPISNIGFTQKKVRGLECSEMTSETPCGGSI